MTPRVRRAVNGERGILEVLLRWLVCRVVLCWLMDVHCARFVPDGRCVDCGRAMRAMGHEPVLFEAWQAEHGA